MSNIFDIRSQMEEKKLAHYKEVQEINERDEARKLQNQSKKIEADRYRTTVIIAIISLIISLIALFK